MSRAARNALASRSFRQSVRNGSALRSPAARALMSAGAATAVWHGARNGSEGWWQHRNGGYGWIGPLFWPFAYYDIYGYTLWGYGYDDAFWGYGYDDIYAGIFGPYGYNDLMGYAPRYAGRRARGPRTGFALAQMCGDDSRNIAGLPIEQIQQAILPTEAQRAALDDLANASLKAAQDIKAACPTDIALTAPSRLAAMQQRIEAMVAAVQSVQPPLEKFYALLSDEQKARINALANNERETGKSATAAMDQNCGASQPGLTAWPTTEIDRVVRPTEAQRAGLTALQDAAARAADMLKAACPTENALTPPARLAAVGTRLDAMLQAVKMVRSALDAFYASLGDEQKANFDAIGPRRAGG